FRGPAAGRSEAKAERDRVKWSRPREESGRVLGRRSRPPPLVPWLSRFTGGAVPEEERTASGDRLSRAAAHRLSLYLRCLGNWPAEAGKVSSGQIARAVGVSDAQVRRDLAALGHLGRRGIGYRGPELVAAIRAAL